MSHRSAVIVVIAVLAVTCWAGVAYSQRPERRSRSRSAPDAPVSQEQPGEIQIQSAKIAAGRIPMQDMLRFLRFTTGKPVIQPSVFDDPMFREDININVLNDVEKLTAEMAMSILSANGYVFYEEGLSDGSALIHVRHVASRQSPSITPPFQVVGASEPIPEGRPHELITAFVELEHADPAFALQVFRELLGIQGTRSAAGELRLMLTPAGNSLLVVGKRSVVRHIREVARHLDVPSKAPAKPGDDTAK